jgi:protein SCO1/2
MDKKYIYLIVFILAGTLGGIALVKQQQKKAIVTLPIFGNPGHVIGNYTFINQNGETVTPAAFENKIYVADYFFTTCKSICPIMSNTLQRVNDTYSTEDRIKFISHTVDPEYDSVAVLADYAKAHNAKASKWHFVTGNKKELYDVARTMYLLPKLEPGDGGADDFIHSQYLVLVDTKKRIRGFYDGTSPNDEKKLIADIKTLLEEEYQ